MQKLDITLYTMTTKTVQFISFCQTQHRGLIYGTTKTFCMYGKKPLVLFHPLEGNSRNGAELSESSLASLAAQCGWKWLHLVTLDASHKVLPHRSLLISAARNYSLNIHSYLLCTCSIQDYCQSKILLHI